MKWIKHLNTINRHKLLVMKHCFRLGLYKQGLLHDLSKYSWVEFRTGAKYYQGTRSPNIMERLDKGYSQAWLNHKGRNKHHIEYWVDYSLDQNEGLIGTKMPKKYVVEMFCDRVAASKIYKKKDYKDSDSLEYLQNSQERFIIHKETLEFITMLLTMLKDEGEDKTFAYIKNVVLKKNYPYK